MDNPEWPIPCPACQEVKINTMQHVVGTQVIYCSTRTLMTQCHKPLTKITHERRNSHQTLQINGTKLYKHRHSSSKNKNEQHSIKIECITRVTIYCIANTNSQKPPSDEIMSLNIQHKTL